MIPAPHFTKARNRIRSVGRIAVVTLVIGSASAAAGCRSRSGEDVRQAPDRTSDPVWQILASDLPGALLSVSGTSEKNMYVVGADKGEGPMVLHFDGKRWSQVATGQRGDLWWVDAFPGGTALLGGSGGMVLRISGVSCERLSTPGLGKQTVYGVWGKSADDFYAVGSAAGRDGFIWHYARGAFEDESLPRDLPLSSSGEVPGFFKVFGQGDEVWAVGAGGVILHRAGTSPFAVIPSPTKDTLFTVHATMNAGGADLLAVGGAANGVLLEGEGGVFRDVSPAGAGLLQGVFAGVRGDWVSGERGMVYSRREHGKGPFLPVDHGLALPATSSLHAIFVDASGGVWSAGGNVLTPALDGGMLIHYGPPVPPVVIDTDEPGASAHVDAGAAQCPAAVVAAGKAVSVARRWDEQVLAAIRLDLPRPTVHARNLFHVSAAMWDAWAAYDGHAAQVFADERAPETGASDAERSRARETAISVAAHDVILHRYRNAVGGARTAACVRAVMEDLGYDANDEHDTGSDPVALGHRIAKAVIAKTANDGSNEDHDYADSTAYAVDNPPLVYDAPGAPLAHPDRWQPINLSVAATQNGIVLPAGVQTYIGAQWGSVTPFAMKRASSAVPWFDPGPVPKLGPSMQTWMVEVIRKTAALDPERAATIDISPGAYGHNSLGANDGKGWARNPVTNASYAPEVVKVGDFARVMAELWADGPKSETPPGHWNVMANMVGDSPLATHKLYGRGEPMDRLSWDVHMYLALNGAEHDAAIAAWDIKRRSATVRPISLIRWMAAKGQSTDPNGPAYDPMGLPIVPGLIEVITPESSAPGERHAHLAQFVGQIAVLDWRGEPGDRTSQASGVGWVRGVEWSTYQRRSFVTPAFPAFVSGHSTFSRAGAEVLASLTGSPYFPGGYAEIVAPADKFLAFEKGPTTEVRLEWASYFDASDQAGQSRLWGGIHIAPDDFAGRRLGHAVGLRAVEVAGRYFDGMPR